MKMKECLTCKELTQIFMKDNPHKKGIVICEDCLVNYPEQPKREPVKISLVKECCKYPPKECK